MNARE